MITEEMKFILINVITIQNTYYITHHGHGWEASNYNGPYLCVCVCVCVCVFFPFILDIKFVGRTNRGHTGFLIHLLSAVRALIFLARRIQLFPSLVDREIEFRVLTIQSFSTRWAFLL